MVFESTVEINDKWFHEYNTNKLRKTSEDNQISDTQSSKSLRHVPMNRKTISSAFDLIFNATLLMAIPIRPIACKSDREVTMVKAFCLAFFALKTVTLAVALTHAYKMLPDFGITLAYYIFNFLSYISMVTLVLKRRRIHATVQTVTRMSRRVSAKKFVGSRTIKFELASCLLTSLFFMIILIVFFFYQEWDVYLDVLHVPILGYHAHSPTYTGLVVFCVVTSYTISFVTCYLSVVLVFSAFLTVGDLLESFAGMIQMLRFQICSSESLANSLTLFREISTGVREVDEALSSCSFFILGTVVSSFFATISVMFSTSPSFQTPVARAYVGLTMVGGLSIFFVMTLSGNKVVSGCGNLKTAVMETSEEMAKYSSDPSVMRTFVLLSDNVRESHLGVTGCEMFVINKGLILTVGGMVITYSFLLFQINQDEEGMKS